jgi:uroporphyrinogen decarboxylase
MNRFERMNAAVAGKIPDQIPVGLWFHFGGELLTPEEQAIYYLRSIEILKWDFLKVMFEYRPKISNTLNLSRSNDLKLLFENTDWEEPFRRQRQCLEVLCNNLKDEMPIVESGYSPWFMLLRLLGHDYSNILISNSEITHRILLQLTVHSSNHLRMIKKMGIYGYFHATLAASNNQSKNALDMQCQYDCQILNAAQDMVRILHLHERNLSLDHIVSYPFEVLSTSDRDNTNPSLKQLRAEFSKCLMGGICEKSITQLSVAKIQEQIAHAVSDAGSNGFILSPGCSVSASLSLKAMESIKNSKYLISRP